MERNVYVLLLCYSLNDFIDPHGDSPQKQAEIKGIFSSYKVAEEQMKILQDENIDEESWYEIECWEVQ